MNGNPRDFEAMGHRLGFRIAAETPETLQLTWQGTRFPAYLCLGIAFLLLFVSVPILQALYLRGFVGPAGSLWYFPLMNFILFAIGLYLLSQKRSIVLDEKSQKLTLTKRSLHRTTGLTLHYAEVTTLKLAMDQVYSGFAVAGSTAAESFPTPALRLLVENGETILLDRGSKRRLEELAKRLSERMGKPLEVEWALQS